jgi:translation initiation factor 3 subunit E
VTWAELKLLEETNMIDFAMDKYTDIGEEVPETLKERREKVLLELGTSREQVLPLLQILEDQEKLNKIKPENFKSITEVCAAFELSEDAVSGLVHFAKLQFDCGNYSMSSELLKHYKTIMEVEKDRPLTAKYISCIWGSLASAILQRDFDDQVGGVPNQHSAVSIIQKLDDLLSPASSGSSEGALFATLNKREVLLQRTWLLHWTIFTIFTADKVNEKILHFFVEEKNLSIISLSCPHLFRYVGACLILQKRIKHLVKDTVWIVHHEAGSYSDPITRFLLALYIDMDFDQAQLELQQCGKVCKGDYFLMPHWPEFEENARLLIFETYCRIHQCINILQIASKLNMEAEEAELWIVKLIQNAKLDARIDSEKSRVVMSKAPASVYQQVIEKTKNLSFKSKMLLSNLEKRDSKLPGH